MKQYFFWHYALVGILLSACSASGPGIFRKQSLHDQYGQKIDAAGLKQTALGVQWFAAAFKALQQPAAITIPYRETGYFAAAKPTAVGLRFAAKRGQKLLLQLDKKASASLILYLELWKMDNAAPSLVQAFDTTPNKHEYEVEYDGDLLLRLQPELLGSGEYTLSISIGPSIGFPVAGRGARIGSIWGDPRDAGARQHQGIDVFAARRTPAIAAASGIITAVNENNLGGRVIWLRPRNKNYTLYYAHLDEQLVQSGQSVQSGDTIGLVGNTGNARSTPPHLHFGIYSMGGAIDPLPFVQPGIMEPGAIKQQPDFDKPVRILGSVSTSGGKSYPVHTVAFPVAVTARGIRVLLPNDTLLFVEQSRQSQEALRKSRVKSETWLLESPKAGAPRIRLLTSDSSLSILGLFNNYAMVMTEGAKGWLSVTDIR